MKKDDAIAMLKRLSTDANQKGDYDAQRAFREAIRIIRDIDCVIEAPKNDRKKEMHDIEDDILYYAIMIDGERRVEEKYVVRAFMKAVK